MSAAARPAWPALHAPASWRSIDFISDLHLAENTPEAFAVWSAYLRDTPADAVFILGDLFEAWVGDDVRDSGFESQCTEVLRDAASRRWLGFMVGNRDFLVGAEMLADCAISPLADPTLLVAFDQRVLLTHGDELCIADVEYQRLRRTVRNPAFQAMLLAKPIAERRELARHARAASEQRHAGQPATQWFDADAAMMLDWMHANDAPILIHGHTHRPGDEQLADGFTRMVLSDWSLDEAAPRAEVLRWQASGFERLAPQAAASGTHR